MFSDRFASVHALTGGARGSARPCGVPVGSQFVRSNRVLSPCRGLHGRHRFRNATSNRFRPGGQGMGHGSQGRADGRRSNRPALGTCSSARFRAIFTGCLSPRTTPPSPASHTRDRLRGVGCRCGGCRAASGERRSRIHAVRRTESVARAAAAARVLHQDAPVQQFANVAKRRVGRGSQGTM